MRPPILPKKRWIVVLVSTSWYAGAYMFPHH